MRGAWALFALGLTGCLALVDHSGPWPCESDADCQAGQTCQSTGFGQPKSCAAPPRSGSDGGSDGSDGGATANDGTYCCVNYLQLCSCTTPRAGCQQYSGDPSTPGTAGCTCGQVSGSGPFASTCSMPDLPWTRCCLDRLGGTCACYPSGSTCDPSEEKVASCSAADTGAPNPGCLTQYSGCSCQAYPGAGATSACPAMLSAVCCQSETECSCSYNGSCPASEQQVPSCRVDALHLPTQCPADQTPVAHCN